MTQINTHKGLVHALSFGQGMKNNLVILVEFNWTKFDGLKLLFCQIIVQCGNYYIWANHNKFNKSYDNTWCNHPNQDLFKFIRKCTFDFEVYAYSNIKPSVEFHVEMSVGKLSSRNK